MLVLGDIITRLRFFNPRKPSVKNNGVTDDVITCDTTKYSSHALAEVVDGKNRNE